MLVWVDTFGEILRMARGQGARSLHGGFFFAVDEENLRFLVPYFDCVGTEGLSDILKRVLQCRRYLNSLSFSGVLMISDGLPFAAPRLGLFTLENKRAWSKMRGRGGYCKFHMTCSDKGS